MTGFDDLILAATPYLATEHIPLTRGTTWWWEYEVRDSLGNLIDVSTGFTITAVICTKTGSQVAAPTISHPASGVIRCTVAKADNADIQPGTYNHEITIVRDSDDTEIIGVGAGGATIKVEKRVS